MAIHEPEFQTSSKVEMAELVNHHDNSKNKDKG